MYVALEFSFFLPSFAYWTLSHGSMWVLTLEYITWFIKWFSDVWIHTHQNHLTCGCTTDIMKDI